jgi:4-amino-4-deoxy-L-arabinose transferase-like glycosyltransferase
MSNGAGKVAPLALVVAALIVRLGWVLLAGGGALEFSGDAKANHDLAVNLLGRHGYATTIDPPHRLDVPYATRPPLTPFALAATYFVFGPHLLVGQLVLVCLGALSVLAVYAVGKQLFSTRVGLIAGSLAAVYPFFVFLAAVPLTENLAILLYTLLAALLTMQDASRSLRHAVLTGCVLGLAALNRPQVLGFVPLLLLLVFVDVRGERLKRLRWCGVSLASAAVIVAPWTVRNYCVIGGWFPISLQGGIVLYQGNSPFTQTALTRLQNGERGWYEDARWGAEFAGLSRLEADRKAFRLAMTFLRKHPEEALRYSVQKVGIFFRAYDHPVAGASWYPVFVLSLLGFYWTARRWRQLLPLYLLLGQTMLTAAMFTSMPRFRAPVEPIFLLMAAVAIQGLWERRARVSGFRRVDARSR